MQRAEGLNRFGRLMAIVLVAALAPQAATIAAAGEDAHVRIGIVGADETWSMAGERGVRVIELLGPRSMRGDLRRGDVILRLDDRRIVVRSLLRDVDREVIRDVRRLRQRTLSPRARAEIRDVIREALRDVRQNVREIHRLGDRDVIVLRDGRARLRDDRARLRDSMLRLRERLRELELDLDGRDWY